MGMCLFWFSSPECKGLQANTLLRQGSSRPDLIVCVQRLLLFVGEEKQQVVGTSAAVQDIQRKMRNGLSPLFYGNIPYMPVYAAAEDQIQFGFVQANGQVRPLHLGIITSACTAI
jgi:hypothetical protein